MLRTGSCYRQKTRIFTLELHCPRDLSHWRCSYPYSSSVLWWNMVQHSPRSRTNLAPPQPETSRPDEWWLALALLNPMRRKGLSKLRIRVLMAYCLHHCCPGKNLFNPIVVMVQNFSVMLVETGAVLWRSRDGVSRQWRNQPEKYSSSMQFYSLMYRLVYVDPHGAQGIPKSFQGSYSRSNIPAASVTSFQRANRDIGYASWYLAQKEGFAS